jgi:hypothetical protein
MKKMLLLFACFLFFGSELFAQCSPGQKQVIVEIAPDNYPEEISWILKVNGNQILNGNFLGDTVCVPENACIEFTIFDSANDGLCCNNGVGFYNVMVNNVSVGSGTEYAHSETVTSGCPPGSLCTYPIVATEGTYTAPAPNYFYEFTPTQTGQFQITTCGLSTCDTKLWVYDACNQQVNNYSNAGTIFYDDDNPDCGTQSVIEGYMEAGQTYLIRVGLKQANTSCAQGTIDFEISFLGAVSGCMDPLACNFNPLATVSDGVCYYAPSPNCTGGPDLLIVEPAIVNSLQIRSEFATDCMVEEGCMNGYGNRTVLAFDTHIKNIGTMDYYVGNPNDNPSQFSFGNCHGHAHYEGYADYILYTPDGASIPIGHKNGFCVMDLECNDGGTPAYGCGNMGISRQCGDIYTNYLDCQWIDITDVDSGQYILAVKVNWDQSPDALGHYESDYSNNWAQVCIRITEDINGNKGYLLLPDCNAYTDCSGTPYGNSVIDCNGLCGGSAVKGDLNENLEVEIEDGQDYVDGILNDNLATTNCNDISGDGMLSIWDAALAVNCDLNPGGNNCTFPSSVTNPDQLVEIGYTTINTTENYIDVYIKNPQNKVVGYELNVSGITILDVENLIDAAHYPVTPSFVPNGNKVIALSYQDSVIPKNFAPVPMLRIYYGIITGDDICVESVVHILNDLYQPTVVQLVDPCVSVAGIEERGIPSFSLYPNPSQDEVTLQLSVKMSAGMKVQLTDAMGRIVHTTAINPMDSALKIDTSRLANGLYNVVVSNGSVVVSKTLAVNH